MQKITIRKGRPEDYKHFSELILLTSPAFLPTLLGRNAKGLMQKLFRHRGHYYSFDRSYFVDIDGKVAGMAQLHKVRPRKREKVRLGLLLMKYLNVRLPARITGLLKSERLLRFIGRRDCYVSSVAVYPEFRSMGLGTKLLAAVEDEAKSIGKKRMLLHAESHNKRAISLYERLGYRIEQNSSAIKIRNRHFEYFEIAKAVAS